MELPENTTGLRMMLTRKRLGLTQEEVAEKANIAYHIYQRMEKGYRVKQNWEYVQQVKKAMGVDFDEPKFVQIIEELKPKGFTEKTSVPESEEVT